MRNVGEAIMAMAEMADARRRRGRQAKANRPSREKVAAVDAWRSEQAARQAAGLPPADPFA